MTLSSAQQYGIPGTRNAARDTKLGAEPFPLDTSELISPLKQYKQTCPIDQGPDQQGCKCLSSIILRLQVLFVVTEPGLLEKLFLRSQKGAHDEKGLLLHHKPAEDIPISVCPKE